MESLSIIIGICICLFLILCSFLSAIIMVFSGVDNKYYIINAILLALSSISLFYLFHLKSKTNSEDEYIELDVNNLKI